MALPFPRVFASSSGIPEARARRTQAFCLASERAELVAKLRAQLASPPRMSYLSFLPSDIQNQVFAVYCWDPDLFFRWGGLSGTPDQHTTFIQALLLLAGTPGTLLSVPDAGY